MSNPAGIESNFFGYSKQAILDGSMSMAVWGVQRHDALGNAAMWSGSLVGALTDVLYQDSLQEATGAYIGGRVLGKAAPVAMGYLNSLPVLGETLPQIGSRIFGGTAKNGTFLQELGSVDNLLYGGRVGEGLPGAAGVILDSRPTVSQMLNMSEKHGVEFSTVYTMGPGKNGGGGYYTLYSGDISSVTLGEPAANRIIIAHTHPKGTANANGYWDSVKNAEVFNPSSTQIGSGIVQLRGDQGALQNFINAGSPQRSSMVLPGTRPDGATLPPFRFDVTSKNLDYSVINGVAVPKRK